MEHYFRKAKQNRIYQDVVDQIQASILDGKITPGSKLPPLPEVQVGPPPGGLSP